MNMDEARAIVSLDRNSAMNMAILVSYFARCHEEVRDALEDADAIETQYRLQGSAKQLSMMKLIKESAYAVLKADENKKKLDAEYANDKTDTTGMV